MKKSDKLTRLEAESDDLLQLLHEQTADENESLTLRECRPYAQSLAKDDASEEAPTPFVSSQRRSFASRRTSPLWMAAALLVGVVIGLSIPRSVTSGREGTALLTDSATHCRSLAAGDVNISLLVALK
ncbi:MAG: hypothetical protein IK000_08585 [Bacteroidaceae bacterium]|nr:hypothetical protein [Bacteroidaceae bacterium]